MNLSKLFSWLTIFLVSVSSSVFAQNGSGDFFWSDRDLAEGAVNGDLEFTVNVGESQAIFLYWSTNGPANSNLDTGGGLDISTSSSGVIQFDSAATLDFDIRVSGIPIGRRWTDGMGGGGYVGPPLNGFTSDEIDNLIAFTVNANGIVEQNAGPVILDEGYDFDSDAFQFARLEFTALTPGTVDLLTIADETGIVNAGEVVPANILGARIHVVSIPEPGISFLLLAGPLLAVRRTRPRRSW